MLIHLHIKNGVSVYNIQHKISSPTKPPISTKESSVVCDMSLTKFCREVDFNLNLLHKTYNEYLENYIACEFKLMPPYDELSFMKRKEECLLYLRGHDII